MSARPRSMDRRNRLSLDSAASELLLLLKLVVLQLELVLLLHDRVKACTETLILSLGFLDLGPKVAHDLTERHFGQLLLLGLTEMKHLRISLVEVTYA